MELALGVGSLAVSLITVIGFALQMQKSAREKRDELTKIGYKQKEDELLKVNVDRAFDKIRELTVRMESHEADNRDEFHKIDLKLNDIDNNTKLILVTVREKQNHDSQQQ